MGGDHKCPVCQATFTRPQHVARHMRSHTGDRPYKCQYCGDQFARSDLLSRHVNKCHANEKPLPSTGTRRKGAASATRATTSKQACDQCVQSSLPCDGANPCSKCIQRKCRCTYVKFHRQTAPAGPGHNPRPSVPSAPGGLVAVPSSSSSRMPMFPQQPEDDFILGPPPSSSSGVPTMAETLYNSNSFAFPPLYPPNTLPSEGADYATKYRAQAQAELFGPGRSGLGTGLTPLYDPRASSANAAAGSANWLGWDQQQPHQQHSQPPDPSGDPYPQHHHEHGRHQDMIPASSTDAPATSAMHDRHLLAGHHQSQHHPPSHYMNISMPYPLTIPPGYGNVSVSGAGSVSGRSERSGSVSGSTDFGRRGSIASDLVGDFGANDFSGSDGSHSIPSSAASSSVHLPLGMYASHPGQHPPHQGIYAGGYDMDLGIPDRAASTSTTSSSSSHHHHQREGSYGGGYAPQDERQEFSSAFGLMSLDDPDVIAGIAVDGQPFFSEAGAAAAHGGAMVGPGGEHQGNSGSSEGDMDTPMPNKRLSGLLSPPGGAGAGVDGGMGGIGANIHRTASGSALPMSTPSREADTRELREFWKQYMRTPLSGPGPAGGLGDTSSTSTNPGGNNKVSTPYRRQRVSSLPSVKTPIVESAGIGGAGGVPYHLQQHHAQGQPHQQQQPQHYQQGPDAAEKLGPTSSMRTTLHQEDLRSYEAAVMARKAPTLLNLQLKKPMKGRGASGSLGAPGGNGGGVPPSAANLAQRPRSVVDSPSSTAATAGSQSSSSSLANAFGTENSNTNVSSHHQQPPPPSAPAGRVAFVGQQSKKEESGSPPSDAGGSSDQDSANRPSFKRLPSQTLGPANAKRAFYGYGDEDTKDRELVGWGNPEHHQQQHQRDPSGVSVATSSTSASPTNPNTSSIKHGMGLSHPDRVIASLAERRRRRMSAPGASLNLGPPSIPHLSLKEGEQKADAGAPYAPAAQGLGN